MSGKSLDLRVSRIPNRSYLLMRSATVRDSICDRNCTKSDHIDYDILFIRLILEHISLDQRRFEKRQSEDSKSVLDIRNSDKALEIDFFFVDDILY